MVTFINLNPFAIVVAVFVVVVILGLYVARRNAMRAVPSSTPGSSNARKVPGWGEVPKLTDVYVMRRRSEEEEGGVGGEGLGVPLSATILPSVSSSPHSRTRSAPPSPPQAHAPSRPPLLQRILPTRTRKPRVPSAPSDAEKARPDVLEEGALVEVTTMIVMPTRSIEPKTKIDGVEGLEYALGMARVPVSGVGTKEVQ